MIDYNDITVYKWPEARVQEQPQFDIENEFYVHGDRILMFDPKTDNIETIEMPGSLTDTVCQVREPIRFLKEKSVKCLKSVSDVLKDNSEFLKKLRGGRILKKPLKTLTSATDDDFLNVTVQICKYTLQNCTGFNLLENVTEEDEGYDECFQTTLIRFHYNHTSLYSLEVSFISYDVFVMNTDVLEESNTKIIQRTSVEFVNFNQNLDHNFRKNQRGYNDEETLLATKLILLNETLKDQPRVLEYFQKNLTISNYNDFSLKIPNSKAGKCVLSKTNFDQIRFNENSLTTCRVEFGGNSGSNATEFCRDYQREIIRYLFNHLNLTSNYTAETFQEHVMVSRYWNPRNDTLQWTKVNLRNLPGSKVEVETMKDQIYCKNLLSTIKYSIFSSKLRRPMKFENLIDRIDVEFGGFSNRKVKINELNRMKIQIYVQFFSSNSIKNCAQSAIYLKFFILPIYIVFVTVFSV